MVIQANDEPKLQLTVVRVWYRARTVNLTQFSHPASALSAGTHSAASAAKRLLAYSTPVTRTT
jgi:hypothetical protein